MVARTAHASLLLSLLAFGCGRERSDAPMLPVPELEESSARASAPPSASPTPEAAPASPEAEASDDVAATLSRPTPWLPEAPHLDSLLPRGPAYRLREQWSVDTTELPTRQEWTVHRVSANYLGGDLDALREAAARLPGTDRRDIPPVVTIVDPALAARELGVQVNRRERAAPVSVWRDDATLGRPVHIDAGALSGRGVRVAVAVFHPLESRDSEMARFADALDSMRQEDDRGLFAAARGLGALHEASLDRLGADVTRTLVVQRVPAPAETRAREAVDLLGDPEAVLARLAAIEDPPRQRWVARISRLARRFGLEVDPEAAEPDLEPSWRTDETQLFVVGERAFVIQRTTTP